MSGKDSADEVEQRTIHGLTDFHDKDIVEIGCGDGRMTRRFAGEAASVLAFDPKEAEIATAKERTPDTLKSIVSFRVADISAIDLPKTGHDVAIISWSL